MGYEELDTPDAGSPGSWRRGWASVGALLATVLLVALVVMVTLSNRARDEAIGWERHTYEVMWLTRTVDASIARSESTLARFVLDEERSTGLAYYEEWRRAGRYISQLSRMVRRNPEQQMRVQQLTELYRTRDREFAAAAAAAVAKQESGGVPLFYQASRSESGTKMRETLDAISDSERELLEQRVQDTRLFDEEAEQLTEYLGWLGVLVGIGAILLGIAAYRALTDRIIARQEAESEASRAAALERAVQDRTRELSEANERLLAEAADREAAEAQLRQVQKMEAVGQLTGGIAHDFNNMLSVVVGGLDLARRKLGVSKRDAESHLDNAMEGATRAAALTRRLLAFSRSEALQPEGLMPADLVRGMQDLIDRTIGERINVETRFPEEPWKVWADANQLENAILNLAVNARDAMDGRGDLIIHIDNLRLGAGQVPELAAGEYVRISVSDTGSGISPEHLQKVFEPFFTTKPVGKGTGLGLSQIFGFARQSGGDVTIDSEVGQGTTVSIYLPRSTRSVEEGSHRGRASDDGAGIVCAPRGTFVLVVEDDPRVRRSTVNALEELGYRVLACESGQEALEIADRNPGIELVITDVMMPEITGPELVQMLERHHPDIRILFVTGYVGEAGDAIDLSGYDLLRKPFTVSALANAVSAAIARPVTGSPRVSATAAAE